jgi:DNA-binding NarL/FixJ family response regulator
VRVLIADDSRLVRERLVALVSELDEVDQVGQADQPDEILRQVRDLKPDVVVLEPRMTRGLGIRVLERIRSLSVVPMVIMLTAFPYAQDRRRCLALGADYYLDKTTDFERVAEVVHELGAQDSIQPSDDDGDLAAWRQTNE